jgi:acyl-CoA synthetase (NDP forming)/RimJ/RimL family protein N-acetyltransferase
VEAQRPYPAHWEADVVLRDGGTARLRPIRPADAEALQRFHVGQSEESTYLRFFTPLPRLSEADLLRFTVVDHLDRVALVAEVGGDIVGVARYDRLPAGGAEVAFNVADAHQGRGLGSVLLEHLAAAARERGIGEFVAEVLPRNQRMLAVLSEAGYAVARRLDDGVVELRFPIEETARSLAVMEAREHRAEARSLHALLNPASVALVGVSRREGTVGHLLLADLLAAGFAGPVHVVHPEADQVLGVPAVPSLDDVPGPVDLVVVAVAAPAVLDVVAQAAARSARGLLVLSGGFAETGPRGALRQRELVRLAHGNGMRVVGPNSWGMINTDPAVRLNVSLAASPVPGRFGVFCQSGAMSVTVLSAAARHRVGLSSFVSAGNRADVSGNDCMQYWEEDARTDVVGLYLESVGNPRKFSRIARRLARAKPVIVVKSGTSQFGAPPGHVVRATLAPREAFEAMLRQSGCIRVENVHQLFDVARLLVAQPLPAGPRVGVLSNDGALAALAADAATSWRLGVAGDPVALDRQAAAEDFRAALTDLLAGTGADSLVVTYVSPVPGEETEVARAVAEVAARAGVPVVGCFPGREPAGEPGLLLYPTPEEALRALAAATRYGLWRSRDPGTRVAPPGLDPDAARRLVEDELAAHPAGRVLPDGAVARLLDCYGISAIGSERDSAVPEGVACVLRSVEDPSFGPVVSFGLAGDASELLGDVGHRIPPLTDRDVTALIRSVRAAPKLFGPQGAPAVDVAALEDLVARLSCLADDLPEVAELELNPVVVAPAGASVRGAAVRLAPPPARTDAGRRELTATS